MILPRSATATCIIVLLGSFALTAGAQWYASDEHGSVREPIPEAHRDRYEHVVRVERTGPVATQIWYVRDEIMERTELEYDGDRLVSRRIYRGGELAATEHYRYWADGSLRLMQRIGERGSTVEYRYRDGRLDEEWILTATSRERIRYDEVGRIAGRTRWSGDEIVERESRDYWGPSARDAVRRIVVSEADRETVSRYDEAGRLLGSSVLRDGSIEAERIRVLHDGRVVEEREERDGVVRVWRYEYDGDVLRRERHLENGALVRTVVHTKGELTRVESLYRDGEETLRITYRGEERVREEIIRDGEVVRTRTFRASGEEDR